MPTVVRTDRVAKRKSTHLTIRSSRYLLPLAVNGALAAGIWSTPGLPPMNLSKSNVIHLAVWRSSLANSTTIGATAYAI